MKKEVLKNGVLLSLSLYFFPFLAKAQGQENALSGFFSIIFLLIGIGTITSSIFFISYFTNKEKKNRKRANIMARIFGIMGAWILLESYLHSSTFGPDELSNTFKIVGIVVITINGIVIFVSPWITPLKNNLGNNSPNNSQHY